MEQIIINKKSGGVMRLFSYAAVSGVTEATQVIDLLGQDVVNITVDSATALKFRIGDWLRVFGRKYTLNALPGLAKNNDRDLNYTLIFEGVQYDLIRVQYLDIDSSGASTGTSFSLMGDLETFAKLIIANAQRMYGAGSWVLGECPSGTETKNMTFTNETCLQVLQELCGADSYDTQFDIEDLGNDRYRLNLRKRNNVLPDTFRYGRTHGLYALERKNVSSQNIITRLFAYGGTQNVPPDYRNGSLNLKMPAYAIFSEGLPYIQNDAALSEFGLVEGSVIFDDIYPTRTAAVTGIAQGNILQFMDTTMPFDLMASVNGNSTYLIAGLTPKIHFNTGNLAGYEFNISAYDHSTHTFTLNTYTDTNGQTFPSDPAFLIQPGDEYVLLDINLPQSYISDAEARLLAKAQEYLSENSRPRVQWSLTIDANFIASKAPDDNTIINYFTVGDTITVMDADLGINGQADITGFTRDILNHYSYELTIGEQKFKPATIQSHLINILKALKVGQNKFAAMSVNVNNVANTVNNVLVNNLSSGGTWDVQW